jgi:outer membrane protein
MSYLRNRKLVSCLIMLSMVIVGHSYARAETLPWLNDPFSTDKKALALVDPNLRPNQCASMPDLKNALSIQEVLHATLCNNIDTRAAYLNLLASASGYGSTLSGYYFPITAGASFTEDASAAKGSKPVSSSGASASVSASMTLFDFGRREASIESAERSLVASTYSYNSFLQGQITNIMFSYYRLLAAQQRVEVAKESERYAEESYEAAKLRHEIGQVPLIDELQAKGSLSQARLSSQSAENQLLGEQATMALLMRLKPNTPIRVRELDDSVLPKDPFDSNVIALMEKAKQERYDLTAARANLKSSEAAMTVLKRRGLPSISAAASASTGGSDRRFDFTDQGSQIGVTLSIPIFTGLDQMYNETAAGRRLSAQREQLEQTELNVEQDVWNSWNNYQTAKLAWETSWDFLASATKFKEIALGRYKEGLGTLLDVLSAQSQYASALQGQLDTHYNLLTARVNLIRSVGLLNIDNAYPANGSNDHGTAQRWNYD